MPHCKKCQKIGLFLNQKSLFILIEMPGRSEFHFSNWSFGGSSCPLAIFNSFVTFFEESFSGGENPTFMNEFVEESFYL